MQCITDGLFTSSTCLLFSLTIDYINQTIVHMDDTHVRTDTPVRINQTTIRFDDRAHHNHAVVRINNSFFVRSARSHRCSTASTK